MNTQRTYLFLTAGLALVTGALSVLALISLSGTPSPLGPIGLKLSWGEDEQARRILEASTAPAALARAEIHARRASQLSPYDNRPRLRLAYIAVKRDGRLGPTGQKLLATSYDLVPFDVGVAGWRTRFALENWAMLMPEDRMAVRKEAFAFERSGSRTANIRNELLAVSDSRGRVAANLWLRSMSAPAPRKPALSQDN